jgi:RNA polymerase sigma factor (sigma-70 family)
MNPEPSFHTTKLHGWLQRMKDGDQAARDELVRGICGRLERLARRMLKDYPAVASATDTADVLQSALMRLLRSLDGLDRDPATTREFMALAAEQVRRELLDLTRHFKSAKRGRGAKGVPITEGESTDEMFEPAAKFVDEDGLELWSAFHAAVEQLPVREREVVGLVFYHGWTQPQVAELLQMSDRQVRRDWRSACLKLTEALGGRLPKP